MDVLGPVLLWYPVIAVIGWTAFPIAYRYLPALHDRGYAFSRALGLLLWGFVFWLLGSYGFLNNDIGGLVTAFLVFFGLSVWAWKGVQKGEISDWFFKNSGYVIVIEVLFLAAFIFLAMMRAAHPVLDSTEKPMELAFINAILRSPSMPPHDPWLADYAISYYYFGFVIVAMLAKLTGLAGAVAFNLGISLVFALAAIGAYGIVYNLLSMSDVKKYAHNLLLALLAPLFVLIVGNAEGFLEYLHFEVGVGEWTQNEAGEWESPFWTALDIKNLENPPGENEDWRFWWWWRGSRVIQDRGMPMPDGSPPGDIEVIDEFPFFSFYLADLHPHVLSMPFVFLAVALIMNLYVSPDLGETILSGWRIPIGLDKFLPAALVLGGLAFLNIWDFPLYVGLFTLVYTYRRAQDHGWKIERFFDGLLMAFGLGIAGYLLYLPFFIGFSSQAGGILPNLINPTRVMQMWVMFAPFFLLLFLYLAYTVSLKGVKPYLVRGLGVSLVISLVLIVIVVSFVAVVSLSPYEGVALQLLGASSLDEVLDVAYQRRWESAGTWLTLTLLIGMAAAVLWPSASLEEAEQPVLQKDQAFAALLIFFGGVLVLTPEFIYLRDQFGTRMNTVFKFYFQAWLIWGTAAAYGAAVILRSAKRVFWQILAGVVLTAALILGMPYSIKGINSRFKNVFGQPPDQVVVLSLDGTNLGSGDVQAVEWLRQAPLGTLVEAVGGSYTGYARVSTYSGQPALLGWPGHESQWRGGGEEMGSRSVDIETLYTTGSWAEASGIIQRYNIRYIYVGGLEYRTYVVNEAKFARFLETVYQFEGVTIYQVPEILEQ